MRRCYPHISIVLSCRSPARERGRSVVLLVLLLLCASLAVAQAGGRATACPTKAALKLDEVVGLVQNKAPDDAIVDLVASCHVGFVMDPATLERLVGAGATRPVLDALDRDTLLRLSLSQARAEVAALENRKRSNEAAVNADRDSALRKSDADYKVQRDKGTRIEPKGPFETTADYNARVQKNQTDLTVMDRSHDADRVRLAEKASGDLARKNESLERRIEFLKRSLYPAADSQPQYIGYSPDDSRLAAGIGGEEFWFAVQPSRAKTMHDQWSAVKVMQRYEDGDSHERFLEEASNLDPVLGRPRSAIEKEQKDQQIQTLLTSARQHLNSRMYEQAKGEYDRILSLDPNNQTAKDGVAASARAMDELKQQQAAAQRDAQDLADLRRNLTQNPKLYPGTWYDAAHGLMWTDKDNGKDVTWDEANHYCQTLTLDSFSDWRLAMIPELQSLYDPSKTKSAKGFPYHIKGDITLGEPSSWSSADTGAGSQIFVFIAGKPAATPKKTLHVRTLCTRSLSSPTVIARVTAPATVAQAANVEKPASIQVGQFICPGTVLGDVDRVIGDDPQAPDRVVRAATKIVEVDPQGVGLFRVEGSPKAYFLKSGDPPQWSCSLATPSAPDGADGILTIRSGFSVRPGVQNPLAGIPYTLLRDDMRTAWDKGGIRVPSGMTPGSFILETCKSHAACTGITQPLNADTATYTDADANGTATFPGVPTGTYYLFVTTTYNNRNYFWTQRIELKAGANSITLDQNNATETH